MIRSTNRTTRCTQCWQSVLRFIRSALMKQSTPICVRSTETVWSRCRKGQLRSFTLKLHFARILIFLCSWKVFLSLSLYFVLNIQHTIFLMDVFVWNSLFWLFYLRLILVRPFTCWLRCIKTTKFSEVAILHLMSRLLHPGAEKQNKLHIK